MEEKKVLLSVQDLVVKFKVRGRSLTAIRGISLDIYEGESIAIVGESGSGKSVFESLVAKAVTSPSMSLVIMSEVAAMQDVVEQHPSALAVHRRNHPVLRQPQHPVQNIHHGAGKRPQAEMLQLTF